MFICYLLPDFGDVQILARLMTSLVVVTPGGYNSGFIGGVLQHHCGTQRSRFFFISDYFLRTHNCILISFKLFFSNPVGR